MLAVCLCGALLIRCCLLGKTGKNAGTGLGDGSGRAVLSGGSLKQAHCCPGPGSCALTCSLEVLPVAAEIQLGDSLRHVRDGRLHVLFSEVEAPGEVQLVQSAHQRGNKESTRPSHWSESPGSPASGCKARTGQALLTISCTEPPLLPAATSAPPQVCPSSQLPLDSLPCSSGPQDVARGSEPRPE